MKKFLLALVITSCATMSSIDNEDDPELYPVCKMTCETKYDGVYGIQYRRIKDDLVFCKCLRHRGDKVIYTTLEHEEIDVEVEVKVTR